MKLKQEQKDIVMKFTDGYLIEDKFSNLIDALEDTEVLRSDEIDRILFEVKNLSNQFLDYTSSVLKDLVE